MKKLFLLLPFLALSFLALAMPEQDDGIDAYPDIGIHQDFTVAVNAVEVIAPIKICHLEYRQYIELNDGKLLSAYHNEIKKPPSLIYVDRLYMQNHSINKQYTEIGYSAWLMC